MMLDKKLKRIMAVLLSIIVFIMTLDLEGIYNIRGQDVILDFDIYNIQINNEDGKVLYAIKDDFKYWTNAEEIFINTPGENETLTFKYSVDGENYTDIPDNKISFKETNVIYIKAIKEDGEYKPVLIEQDKRAPEIIEGGLSVDEKSGIFLFDENKDGDVITQYNYYTNAECIRMSIKDEESGISKIITNTKDDCNNGVEVKELDFSKECEVKLFTDSDTYLWIVDNCENISSTYHFVLDKDSPEILQVEKYIDETLQETEQLNIQEENNIYTNKTKIKIKVKDEKSQPNKLLIWTDSDNIEETQWELSLKDTNECDIELGENPVLYFAAVDNVGNGSDRVYVVRYNDKAPTMTIKKNRDDLLTKREDGVKVSNQNSVRIYTEEKILKVIYGVNSKFADNSDEAQKKTETDDSVVYYEINELDVDEIYYLWVEDQYGNISELPEKIMYTKAAPEVEKIVKINSDGEEIKLKKIDERYWVNQNQIKIYIKDDSGTEISKILCGAENNIDQAKLYDDIKIEQQSVILNLPEGDVNFIWIYNAAGNCMTEPIEIRKDINKPSIKVPVTAEDNTIIEKNSTYRTNKKNIEFFASDEDSGIACIKYLCPSSMEPLFITNDTNSNPFTYILENIDEIIKVQGTSSTELQVWCIDQAGNESDKISIIYDNEVVYTVKQNSTPLKKDDGIFYVSIDNIKIDTMDEESGIKSVQLKTDSPNIKIIEVDNNLYEISGLKLNEKVSVKIVDNLGNEDVACIEYVKDEIKFTLVDENGEEREHDDDGNIFYTNSTTDIIHIMSDIPLLLVSSDQDKNFSEDALTEHKNIEESGYDFKFDEFIESKENLNLLKINILLRAEQSKYYTLFYDIVPPKITLNFDEDNYVNSKTEKYIEINVKDYESGIADVIYYYESDKDNYYSVTPDEEGKYLLKISEIVDNIGLSEGDNTIKIVANDRAGNHKEESVVVKYDETAPDFKSVFTDSASGYVSKQNNASIRIKNINDVHSGIKSVKYLVKSELTGYSLSDTLEVDNKNALFSTEIIGDHLSALEGKCLIKIIVTDVAGNVKESEAFEITIDTTPPMFESEYGNHNEWINGKQEAKISITKIEDKLSGVKQVKYYLDSDTTGKKLDIKDNAAIIDIQKMIKNKTLSDGKHKIQIVAEDNEKNKRESSVYEVWVDTTGPYIKSECNLDNEVWINAKNTAEISITEIKDELSGIKQVKYYLDSDTTGKKLKITDNAVKIDIQEMVKNKTLSDGKHKIKIVAEDNMNNKSESLVYEVWVDTTKPDFESKCNWKNEDWINAEKEAKISMTVIKDDFSEIKQVKYYLDNDKTGEKLILKGNTAVIDIQKMIIEENLSNGIHKIQIVVEDDAGNKNHSTIYEVRVDTEAPVISEKSFGIESIVSQKGYSYFFRGDTEITIAAEDKSDNFETSGLESITLILENPDGSNFSTKTNKTENKTDWKTTFNIPAGFKGNIYVYATDKAGNGTQNNEILVAGVVVETEELHNSNCDITFTKPKTILRDGDGNELYRESSIPITIDVTDNFSGIRQINWNISSSDSGTSSNQSGQIDIVDKEISNNSDITNVQTDKDDENIVTHLSKTIRVSDNSNNIVLTVTMTDNAGHTKEKETVFSNDTTEPIVTVTYDNNTPDIENDRMFNQIRTATISVTERNFNPDQAVINITNTDNIIPNISGWTMTPGSGNLDNSVYTAIITYSADGDYEFDISLQDMAGNPAQISYGNSVVPQSFTIDRTKPILTISYDNNNGSNNYFKDSRIAMITVNEHNFSEDRLNLTVTKNGIAQPVQTGSWSHNNDIHSTTVMFSDEAEYSLMASYVDMAGNTVDSQITDTFFVDKSEPQMLISGIENQKAYKSDQIGFEILSTDIYFDSLTVALTRIDSFGNQTAIELNKISIENGEKYSIDNLTQDGIYRLSYTATDKSERRVDETLIFSVNRNGSTYMLSDQALKLNKSYVKSVDSDIVIKEVNVNELLMDSVVLTLSRGSSSVELKEGIDYIIQKNAGSGQWCEYVYTIKKSCFTEDGVYSLSISSKDSSGNISVSDLEAKAAELTFAVDKTAPICNVMNLKSGTTYAMNSKRVEFTVSDNIMLSKVSILLNGTEVLDLTEETLRQIADNGENISFDISNSDTAQTVVIQYLDKAGNEGITEIKDFYVTTNPWIRYTTNKPLMISTIIGAVAVLGLLASILMYRRKARQH